MKDIISSGLEMANTIDNDCENGYTHSSKELADLYSVF
jgi:hypothetical protein